MATLVKVATQYRLDGTEKPISVLKWAPGEMTRLRAQTRVERCEGCDKIITGRKITEFHTFSPWSELDQVEGDSIAYLCESCNDRGVWDEGTFYCEGCERHVYESNGHRNHVVRDPEWPDMLCCVGCAQRYLLKYGHSDAQLSDGMVHCDFYSYHELTSRGWEEGQEFGGGELEYSGGKEWRDYCKAKKAEGYMVITDQGRTSIVGGPDSVTVWLKKPVD